MDESAASGNWLVVGLGNPGPQYLRTRHNLGFMLIDKLADRMQTQVRRDECKALVGRGLLDGQVVELVKPQTFMNLSGDAVRCLTLKPDRSVERLIAISDDLALPFGDIRIRPKGSHGGQNGLRSLIDRLGTQEFIRVRIGIAPDHPVADASRFVLEEFRQKDVEKLEEVLDLAADAVEHIVTNGVDAAMAKFN